MADPRLPRSLFLTGAAAAVLGLAACGSQDDEAQGSSDSTDSSSPSSTPEPVELPGGVRRSFLEDSDSLVMRGWCQGNGYRVGFGEVEGTILAVE